MVGGRKAIDALKHRTRPYLGTTFLFVEIVFAYGRVLTVLFGGFRIGQPSRSTCSAT